MYLQGDGSVWSVSAHAPLGEDQLLGSRIGYIGIGEPILDLRLRQNNPVCIADLLIEVEKDRVVIYSDESHFRALRAFFEDQMVRLAASQTYQFNRANSAALNAVSLSQYQFQPLANQTK